MLSNEGTTRSEIVAVPGEIEALVAAPGRDQARALVTFLKGEKLNISFVQDADGAFEEALLHRPNIILVHEDIEKGRGIELCRRLKANSRTHFLPTILITSRHNQDNRIRAIEAGVDAIFDSETDEKEKRTRLWALLRSQALYRRQDKRQQVQGAAIKERGRWIGTFVHDLQNAIGALQANFEYLAQTSSSGSNDHAKDVEDCVRETRALLLQLTRGLRTVQDYERFESGHVSLKEIEIEVDTLVGDIKEELGWQGNGARKPVLVDMGAPGAKLVGDPDLLRQAIASMAAYLFRQPRTNRVLIRTRASGGSASIMVSGDGEAIPAAEHERLFEPYVRVPRRAPLAHGLGLALARVVIDLHGGSVRAENQENQTTAFVVELKSQRTSPKSHRGE